MDTHTIRLGSAWEPAADGAAWSRRFGRPGGLGPGDRVLLVIAARTAASVTLNAAPLPDVAAAADWWRHDITPLLRDRNVLVLAPAVAATPSSSVADAAHGRSPLPETIADVSLEIVPSSR